MKKSELNRRAILIEVFMRCDLPKMSDSAVAGPALRYWWLSLRPMIPATTRPAESTLKSVAGSLKKRIPTAKVPIVPIPVHTA